MRSGRGSITPHLTELGEQACRRCSPHSLFHSVPTSFLRRKINHRLLPQRFAGCGTHLAKKLRQIQRNLGLNPTPFSAIRAYGYRECKNRKKRTAAASGWRNIMPEREKAKIFHHESDFRSPPLIDAYLQLNI